MAALWNPGVAALWNPGVRYFVDPSLLSAEARLLRPQDLPAEPAPGVVELQSLPQTRRCGWGVCSAHMDDNGIFTRTVQAYGNLFYRAQAVPLAESHAFLFSCNTFSLLMCTRMLLIAVASSMESMLVDNKCALAGAFTLARGSLSLSLSLFDIAEDLGLDCIVLIKVAAHDGMTLEQRYRVLGNNFADALAKKGAALHTFDKRVYDSFKHEHAQVVAIGKYLTFSALECASSASSDVKLDRILKPGSCLGISDWKYGMHQPTLHRGRYRCSLRLASSSTPLRCFWMLC